MKRKSYPKYKDSGVQWLGKVPEHWNTWKVTHGFGFVGSGTTPKSDNPLYYDGDIPWVTTSELRENVILSTRLAVTQKAIADYSSLKIYNADSLLIAMYGATIGRLGILGIKATVNQACCVFDRPERFYIKFVYYWLWMARPILISMSSGGGQPNLSQDLLKRIRIPAPPLPEQTAIAAFLDRKTAQIDALIQKEKDLIERLREQRIAVITHAVTKGLDPKVKMKNSGVEWLGLVPEHWEVRRLRFSVTTNPVKSELSGADPLTAVSFVPMEAVGEYGGLGLDAEKSLENVASGYTYFRDNDVVVAKITPCFENGKGALAKGLQNGIAFGTTELHALRSLKGLGPQFLFYLTISHAFRTVGASEMLGAGGQKRVPEEFIKNFVLGLPPLPEQSAIVAFLDQKTGQIDALIHKAEDAVAKLEEYRMAVITAAVTGKVDVRE